MKKSLILFFVNIELIFSLGLGKYKNIETEQNSIVFESESFNLGDEIEFIFSTTDYCENILHYQFYDEYRFVFRIFIINLSLQNFLCPFDLIFTHCGKSISPDNVRSFSSAGF